MLVLCNHNCQAVSLTSLESLVILQALPNLIIQVGITMKSKIQVGLELQGIHLVDLELQGIHPVVILRLREEILWRSMVAHMKLIVMLVPTGQVGTPTEHAAHISRPTQISRWSMGWQCEGCQLPQLPPPIRLNFWNSGWTFAQSMIFFGTVK
jgi:hypothetical protein